MSGPAPTAPSPAELDGAAAFIGLGAAFATTAAAGAAGVLPFGVTRVLVGLVFSLGLTSWSWPGPSSSPATT